MNYHVWYVYSESGIDGPSRMVHPNWSEILTVCSVLDQNFWSGPRFWKFDWSWGRNFPRNFKPESLDSAQYCNNDDRYGMLYIGPLILNSYNCYNEFSFNNFNYCFRYDGVSKLLSDQKSFFFRSLFLFSWYARWIFLF